MEPGISKGSPVLPFPIYSFYPIVHRPRISPQFIQHIDSTANLVLDTVISWLYYLVHARQENSSQGWPGSNDSVPNQKGTGQHPASGEG